MAGEPSDIQIKGIRDGLMVTFGDSDWNEQAEAFFHQIDEKPDFFKSARIALDVGEKVLRVAELAPFRDSLSERGISLWAVISQSPATELTAQNLGMATRLSKPKVVDPRELVPADNEEKALWIKQTLRSGAHIEFPGNIVVFGDVNPGAEIIAGGSVLVWGRVRGLVHAGAGGDEQAQISAIEFDSPQLRIAKSMFNMVKKNSKSKIEIARLVAGELMIETWKPR